MKVIKFIIGYVYYFCKALLTSPAYAFRRACGWASGAKKRTKKLGLGPNDKVTFVDDPNMPSKPNGKRHRRGHRGGRKHRKNRH